MLYYASQCIGTEFHIMALCTVETGTHTHEYTLYKSRVTNNLLKCLFLTEIF